MLDSAKAVSTASSATDAPTTSARPWLNASPGGIGVLTSWITPQGEPRLASSGTDATIQIWDPDQQLPLGRALEGHTDGVWTLAVWTGPHETVLFSTGEDGTIRQWNTEEYAATGPVLTGHVGWVRALAVWEAPDGRVRLASAGADGSVRIWDPAAGIMLGEPLEQRQGSLASLSALAVWHTPEGNRLAAAGDDGTVRIWDPDARRLIADRQIDHGVGIWALTAWTAADNAARLAASGQDGSIHIWNPTDGVRIGDPLSGHVSWVPSLSTWRASDGSTRLVSAGTDKTIRQWDPETGTPIGVPLIGHAQAFAALATWSARGGGGRLAFVGDSRCIRIWDADMETVLGELPVAHTAGRWALANWPDAEGTRLAVGGDDGDIQIWNADTGQMVGSPLQGHTAALWALATWTDAGESRLLASAGDDGSVRIWDIATGYQLGPPMLGHSGWIPVLTTWQRPDGRYEILSGGFDGTIRRWDPVTQEPIGAPLDVAGGWIMSLVVWDGADGPRMACGDSDGQIRIWDLNSMSRVGHTIEAHQGWVRALAIWTDRSGGVQLISGGYDGAIRRWRPDTGAPIGELLGAQDGRRMAALAIWYDGGPRLAATGTDSLIRVWDLESTAEIGPSLAGHDGGLWALSTWVDSHARIRLASAGYNGEVWLWDPHSGRPLLTIECGPVALWGISDAPTSNDCIGRDALAKAIADQLYRSNSSADSGPTVIGIDGPWGSGKSTLMKMVRAQLPPPQILAATGSKRFLTVQSALRQIRRYTDAERPPSADGQAARRGVVTAWFNPWTYQSGEQVWAGLANEIIESARVVLYPTEAEREHYWFSHNLGRIDRYAVRRSLRLRTISPVLGLALLGSVAFAISQLNQPLKLIDLTLPPAVAALLTAAVFLLIGTAHTLARRIWGRAVHYLPSDLVSGPVVGNRNAVGRDKRSRADADPLREAVSGGLYLHQHHIDDVINDLAAHGDELVVFVDDIDRCRAGTAVEVFEAINLFLSNVAARSGLRARFVIGLDSVVVASHLDGLYEGHPDLAAVSHGDDPSPGWAFLRKLIQIPVRVPHVSDAGVHRLVDALLGGQHPAETGRPGAVATAPDVDILTATPSRTTMSRIPRPRAAPSGTGPPAVPVAVKQPRARAGVSRSTADTFTWRSTERHPQFHTFVTERLAAQPNRSVREAKRLLNVWQLYARILDVDEPLSDPGEIITRAKNLLILAEIITRWPAIQSSLHRRIDGRAGLSVLADAAGNDQAWQRAVLEIDIDTIRTRGAVTKLRALLTEYDGVSVAHLATRLL